MILAARTGLVLGIIIVLGLANYMAVNGSNITHFMLGSAFAQTDNATGDNSTDLGTIPQDNSTDLGTIPQDNSTDLGTIPGDNSTDLTAGPDDNLTGTQNQTSNAVPEFPVALIVLVIAIASLVTFYRIKPIKI